MVVRPGTGGRSAPVSVADAYSAGADAWARGPMRVYGRLAELLVAQSDVRGRDVLDLGTGTGAVSRIVSGDARVVALDAAEGMLRVDRAARPPGVVGDALALPFRDDAFDAVIAAFALNHLDDPSAGVREAGRVARDLVLISTYAEDDDHPVKRAVEQALVDAGWVAPAWHATIKAAAVSWGTVPLVCGVVERAGLVAEKVEHVVVPFPELSPVDLVRWRLGMAQCAEFAADRGVEARAVELLGDCEPLVRSVIFVTARVR